MLFGSRRVPTRAALACLPLLLVACAESSTNDDHAALSAGDRPVPSMSMSDAPAAAPTTTNAGVSSGGPVSFPPAGPGNTVVSEQEPPAEAAPAPIEVDVNVPLPRPSEAEVADAGAAESLTDAGAVSAGADAPDASPNEPLNPGAIPAPDSSTFAIELSFEDGLPEGAVLDAFLAAKARWESVIVGDVPDVMVSDKASCDGHELPEWVDDIVVFVRVSELDGPQGLLGSAGPCAVRSRSPRLPFAAAVEFDSADLEQFAAAGRLEEVVLHEMGHALGLGSLWEEFGLIDEPSDGSGDADTAFNGESARAAFDLLTDGDYDGNRVPVENVGSAGEINGHWRESAMGNELMTTRMGASTAVLSSITIAALADMGYQVDVSQADEYTWPAEDPDFAFRVFGAPVSTLGLDLHDHVRLPQLELTDDGRLRALGRR